MTKLEGLWKRYTCMGAGVSVWGVYVGWDGRLAVVIFPENLD